MTQTTFFPNEVDGSSDDSGKDKGGVTADQQIIIVPDNEHGGAPKEVPAEWGDLEILPGKTIRVPFVPEGAIKEEILTQDTNAAPKPNLTPRQEPRRRRPDWDDCINPNCTGVCDSCEE